MTIARSIRQFYSSLLVQRTAREPSTRVFAYGFVVSVVSTLVIQAFNALINVVIARSLGVEQFGLYTSVVVNLGLLSALLGLGLDTWLIYEGARRPDSLLHSAQQVMFVKLGGALIMLVVIALASVVSSEHLLLLVLGALGALFDGFLQTGVAVLRAQYRNGMAALLQLIAPLFLMVAFVLLFTTGLTATRVLALQALGSAVALVCALPATRVLQRPLASVRISDLVRRSRFFLAADVLATVYGLSTIVLIGYFAGTVATGLFKPASNIVGLTFIVPSLVYTISLPMLSSPALSRQNRRKLLGFMALLIAAYGVFFLVVLWFFGEAILRLLYGEPYAAGYAIIRIMSVIPLFKGSSFICVAIMVSHGQQHRRVALQFGAASLSVLGGLLIIPAFGIQGAAALQVVVEFVLLLLYALGARWTARRWSLAESRS